MWVPLTEVFIFGRTLKLLGEQSYGREIDDYTDRPESDSITPQFGGLAA
jgi:hypothetical protein